MLHLDMKPRNIMRDTKGNVFLIDFGLSKQYDKNGEPESSTSIGLGTPGYAPIEQANNIQGKTGSIPMTIDVYALGATLFKMLTGNTPPFASAILNDGFPSDFLSQAGVSHATIMIVEKAMSPMRKQRYQTIDEMLRDIAAMKKVNSTDGTPDNEETTIMASVDDAKEKVSSKIKVWDKPKYKKPLSKKLLIIGIAVIILFFGGGFYLYDNTMMYDTESTMSHPKKKTSAPNNGQKDIDVDIRSSCNIDPDFSYTKEIDLGLPSGTIWAGWNIGASKAEDAGGLYAWGDTISRKVFKHYFDSSFTEFTLAKGATSILYSDYDVAHVAWGGGWRMPTKSEFAELCRSCTWRYATYRGSKGIRGKGPNGNTIFFPVTGYGNENGVWCRKGDMAEGAYFCGELCDPKEHDHSSYASYVEGKSSKSQRAYIFSFHYEGMGYIGCGERIFGYAIRAVKPQHKVSNSSGKTSLKSRNNGGKNIKDKGLPKER